MYLILQKLNDEVISTCIQNAEERSNVEAYILENNLNDAIIEDSNNIVGSLSEYDIIDGILVKSQSKSELIQKNLCKSIAKRLIAETDWAVLPDVNLLNKTEFETYRATLRNLIINPVINPIFPDQPIAIWT